MNYHAYINSPRWYARRREHFAADPDNAWCFVCHWHGKSSLHVHHNTYERLGREEAGDLVSLCKDCHKAAHRVVDAKDTSLREAHLHVKALHDSGVPVGAIAGGAKDPRKGRPSNPRSHRTRKNRVLTHIRHIEANLYKLSRRTGLTDVQVAWLEEVKKLVANAPSEW